MPHMSPMQWLIMLLLLWMMLTLISMNMFFFKLEQLTCNNQMHWTNTVKWSWYQDKNSDCKFIND